MFMIKKTSSVSTTRPPGPPGGLRARDILLQLYTIASKFAITNYNLGYGFLMSMPRNTPKLKVWRRAGR